jgi:hypothetical protein
MSESDKFELVGEMNEFKFWPYSADPHPMTNESQHPTHTVTLAVTRMASSIQTGVDVEEGTLRIGTELDGSVVGK